MCISGSIIHDHCPQDYGRLLSQRQPSAWREGAGEGVVYERRTDRLKRGEGRRVVDGLRGRKRTRQRSKQGRGEGGLGTRRGKVGCVEMRGDYAVEGKFLKSSLCNWQITAAATAARQGCDQCRTPYGREGQAC